MKKFLHLLLLLGLVLPGFGQKKSNPTVTISYGGQSYQVVTNVPINTYAVSGAGKTAMETAIKNGEWTLTTLDGCVIPKGTKPPKVKPTGCSTVIDVAYNQSLAATSATGSGNTYDRPGATGNKIKDGELTYSFAGLPAPGSYTVTLGYQSNTNVPTAQVSVNNGSPQTIQLIASEGSLATATATLTGFVSGSNLVKVTPSGYFAQDYLRVSRVGSTTVSQPPSVTVTNPGSGTTTDALFSFAVPTAASPWHGYSSQGIGFIKAGQDGYTTSVIIGDYDQYENDYLIVQIRNGMGGFVQVTDKATGRKLMNGPDLGRGNGASSYSQGDYTNNVNFKNPDGSNKFSYNGAAPAPGPWFTGYNPLLNGDFKGHPSTSLFHGFVTINGKLYTYDKRQLNSWSHADNRMEKMYHEQWVNLTGKVVDMHIRLTHNRDDVTDYGPYLQEWRLSMVNGNRFKAVFYNGNQPYTFATPSRHNGLDNGGSINNRDFPVSEPFIGVEIDDQNPNRIFAHYAPDMWDPSFEHMDSQEGSDCDGCREGMYTSGHVLANLDAKGVWLFHDTWIVGDLNSDVRPFIYAQPRPNAPVWNFNASTGRNGWAGFNGLFDPQYPNSASASGWNLTLTGKADGGAANLDNSFIISPRTAFKASTCPTLYFTVKSRNLSQTAWQVKYTYVGQDREYLNSQYPTANSARYPYSPAVRSSAQAVPFTMTNDNTVRTYAIPMNWDSNSHISTVEIWPNGQTPGGGNWDVQRIGCSQP